MGNTIYGSFEDPSLAERAAGALLDFGARPEDVSLVRNHHGMDFSKAPGGTYVVPEADPAAEQHLAYTGSVYGSGTMGVPSAVSASDMQSISTGYGDMAAQTESPDPAMSMPVDAINQPPKDAETDYEREAKEGLTFTTPADAGMGAAKGLAWGVGVGVLAGVASLIVPGVGLVLGGGALATALGGLAGAAGAGAVAGAVTGYLKDQGMDEHLASNYQNVVESGGAILAVSVPSGIVEEDTVRRVMEKYGAERVNAYASRGYMA
ncbi:MAG TPA: hypothetical protein VG944_06525 [Fimbriimonas sp.]|nr:hypothetical protein [Fimbriimonas sp.]